MRQLHIVVETVLYRRTGGKLCLGQMRRIAVASTWAAVWRKRSISVICGCISCFESLILICLLLGLLILLLIPP